jgi:hypothetical protein
MRRRGSGRGRMTERLHRARRIWRRTDGRHAESCIGAGHEARELWQVSWPGSMGDVNYRSAAEEG